MADLTPVESPSAATPRRRFGMARQLLLLAVGVVLLALVLSRITVADLRAIVSQGQPLYLLIAVAGAVAIYIIMPIRLQRSLAGSATLPFAAAFTLSVRQSLLLLLLPARGGDLAYPWMLARAAAMPVGRAIANLVVIRLCDITVLCLAAALGVTALFNGTDTFAGFLVWVLVIALAGLLALVFMADLFGFASRRFAATRLARTRPHRWLFEARRGARLLLRRRLAELLGWTLARWAVSMVFLWAVFSTFGLDLGPLQIVFVSAVLNVVAIVPIQTFGSFGVAEGALAVALAALGVEQGTAAATALLARTTWFVLVLGVGGGLLLAARVARAGVTRR